MNNLTNFEMVIAEDLLDEKEVRRLWDEVVKEAKETEKTPADVTDHIRNAFVDSIADYIYETIKKLEGGKLSDLLATAVEDYVSIEDIVDYLIVNKNLTWR